MNPDLKLPDDLFPGDICLYASPDVVDAVIEVKTGGDVAHIEIYMGHGISFASRNGIGVNAYDFRREGLVYVLRPVQLFGRAAAVAWFEQVERGKPYGFGDILANANMVTGLKGEDCSHFAAALMVVAACPQFADGAALNKISPRDFTIVRESAVVWSKFSA